MPYIYSYVYPPLYFFALQCNYSILILTRQEKYCIISDKNQLFFSESWVIMQTLFFANGLKTDMFFEFNKWTDINCPKHCHYTFEVVFVDSGEFIIEKENVTYKLFKNDVMVIMPFEKHRFRTEKNSRISVLEMSTNIISNFDAVFRNRRLKNCCCNLSGEEIKDIYTHLDNENKKLSADKLNEYIASQSKISQTSKLRLVTKTKMA